jgi:DNA-3-methyladenine glycosylase
MMKQSKLGKDFYSRDAVEVAKDLLGKYIIHVVNGQELIARVVETEAYMGQTDKAAHSYNNRRTKRTEVMFGPAGCAYVYLIYGMYYCMNVVAADIDIPQAVLIRAVEPIDGINIMTEHRYGKSISDCSKKEILNLTNGPGKLCQAMNITKLNNGEDLTGNRLYFVEDSSQPEFQMITTTRININYAEEAIHFPYRFYINGNRYVSVRDKSQPFHS